MSGGFALNCPTNSSLLNNYKFKNFTAPPCINDSGQSLGMALYHFYINSKKKLEFSLNSAFYGKEVDRNCHFGVFSSFPSKFGFFSELQPFFQPEQLNQSKIFGNANN